MHPFRMVGPETLNLSPWILEHGIAGYGRLSRRDEADTSTPDAVKVDLRRRCLLTIAEWHQVALTQEGIVFDLGKSGGSLLERDDFVALLGLCETGRIHTLVIEEIERSTRDVGDWKRIERALFRGRVRLVTARGAYTFDEDFDPSLLQVIAVFGERERRQASARRRIKNVQRALDGQLSMGHARYGYTWDTAARCFRTDPLEYPILVRILQSYPTDGAHTIAKRLNAEQIPPPGIGRRRRAAPIWLSGTVRAMVANPSLITGYLVRRVKVDREGRSSRTLEHDWVWSKEPLTTILQGETVPLEHPITVDEWRTLNHLASTRAKGLPRRGALTGILRCSAGYPMHRKLRDYICECPDMGRPSHRGMNVRVAVVEAAVWLLLDRIIAELPAPRFRKVGSAQSAPERLAAEAAALARQIQDKERTIDELINRTAFYDALPGYGEQRRLSTLTQLGKEIEALEKRRASALQRLAEPTMVRLSPVLAQIAQSGGIASFIDRASDSSRRAVVLSIIKRITLAPSAGHTRCATVTLHPIVPTVAHEITLVSPRLGEKRGPYKRKDRPI